MVKQVIVLRTSYPDGKGGTFKPRLGKLVAQAAHASMKVFLDRKIVRTAYPDKTYSELVVPLWDEAKEWIEGSFTKIVVGIDSEQGILDLLQRASEAGLPTALVIDNGATEFHGNRTVTCIAIGPAKSEDIDPFTSHLKLL